MPIRIIGHRGNGPTSRRNSIPDHLEPENTIASFRKALETGADGVELDISVTKDNVVVVTHDDELNKNVVGADRNTKELGNVQDYTYNELLKFDVGRGERIPKLVDVLALAEQYKKAGRKITVNVELRGEDPRLIKELAHTLLFYLSHSVLDKSDFVFNSFKWDKLRELRAYDDDYKLVPNIGARRLYGEDNVEMPGFKVKPGSKCLKSVFEELGKLHREIGCHAFDCVIPDIRPELIAHARKLGVGIYASQDFGETPDPRLPDQLRQLVEWSHGLPVTYFKADDTESAIALVRGFEKELSAKPRLVQHMLPFSGAER